MAYPIILVENTEIEDKDLKDQETNKLRAALGLPPMKTKSSTKSPKVDGKSPNLIEKQYKCADCEYTTPNVTVLANHTKEIHEKCSEKDDENSQIINANVSFEGKTLLEIEIKTKKIDHEGKESVKKIKCSLCDAEYTLKGNLKKHIESVHDGNKPFKCVQCPSRFAQLSGLNRHFEAVHEKKRPFECTHCERCFYEKNKLKKHMESVHDVSLETIDDKQICFVCDKNFESKKALDIHISSAHKGQLISEFHFDFFKFSKKPTKNFTNFCAKI